MKSRKFLGRKLYSFFETYIITVKAFRMMPVMARAEKNKLVSKQFRERIMLAVTNVNGCPMCSYAHTKMALESGMSNSEIQNLLDSEPNLNHSSIPEEEAAAIFFAQHYADSRCKPDKEAWQNIVDRYGRQKALAILSAIRIITMGNAFGVRLGGITDRIHGKEFDKRTNPLTSILFLLASIITIPFVLIHVLVLNLFKIKYI
ncbi:MAG: hypothetical protein BKP49_11255 [Treponema sp. CETP13]|nr:MAG: hypothetical protein BKP49_11255 [Treponema sp. CETP13]